MSHVEVERNGAVLHIAINRPEKKNALTAEMYSALADAVDQAEADPGVRVILLCGRGDAFTAGNDLEDFMKKPWKGQAVPPAVRFIRTLAMARKPVVAAVQGLAVGVGTTILLHCDLVYAAEDTRFMMPFINLGIVPEAAATVLVPLLVGRQRAAELFFLSSPLTAQRAYETRSGQRRRCFRRLAGRCFRSSPAVVRKTAGCRACLQRSHETRIPRGSRSRSCGRGRRHFRTVRFAGDQGSLAGISRKAQA